MTETFSCNEIDSIERKELIDYYEAHNMTDLYINNNKKLSPLKQLNSKVLELNKQIILLKKEIAIIKLKNNIIS